MSTWIPRCFSVYLQLSENGTLDYVGEDVGLGGYEDIYTGHCCSSYVRRQ